MSLEKAKQVIEAAINQATLKGCYNLQDVAQILEALKVMYSLNELEKK
jgi:ferric-dicitrate binding protein FerR (iron transport regulator)